MTPEEFRKHAAELVRLAEKTNDPAAKLSLVSMARAWIALADLAAKNGHTDIVYETPQKLLHAE